MEWWQITLILLASIVVGLLVGGLIGYLILRFSKLRAGKKREVPSPVEEQPTAREAALPVEEQLKGPTPDLLAEIENNHKLATGPWTGKLLPFQTQVWEARQDEVNNLPADLRQDVTQVYIDIRLANTIAWLSTEFGRRNQNLDESYGKLRANIAKGLERIKPLIQGAGK